MAFYTPYTYLIGWSWLDKWYYGCRHVNSKRKIANPADLWVTYFTSSKTVKQFRKHYGEPDIIQIRKTFKTSEETLLWESKVLKKLNVINQDKWLNKSNNKAIDFASASRGGKIGGQNGSKEGKRLSGLNAYKNKTGIFKLTKEERHLIAIKPKKNYDHARRSEVAKKGGGGKTAYLRKVGIHALSKEQKSELGKRSGKLTFENKTGIHGASKEQRKIWAAMAVEARRRKQLKIQKI